MLRLAKIISNMWAAGSGTLARDTFRFPIKARSLSTTHTLEPSSNTHGRDSSVGNDVLASKKRQLWLGMSPAGSQWPGMAKSLMSIPVFAKSINNSAAILEEVSVDVKRSILDEKSNFADIVHSIDGIMTVEIALVDVLYHLGLQPDRIVGLSLGEFGCGYADGAISARQALLGLHHAISAAAKKHHGQQAMAVVCLSRDQVIKRCPDGVYVAIDGGHSVVVVGGSKGAVELFMGTLQEDGVTVIMADTGNVAFHTPLIGDCRCEASTAMRPILPELKQRSPRWLSSTIPFADWTQESSHNLNYEYFVKTVYEEAHFSQIVPLIPSDAIVVEVGPNTLLLGQLQHEVGSDVILVPLLEGDNSDNNMEVFLAGLAKIREHGHEVNMDKLFTN